MAAYLAAIAAATDEAYESGASVIALAQASMAGAADMVKAGPKPLTSPTTGLAAPLSACSPNDCMSLDPNMRIQ